MGISPRRGVIVAVATAALVASSIASVAHADTESVMVPIGGGYETPTLEEFGRSAAEGATGTTVDIVVVPSSYGNKNKDRAENLALAQERTDQVDAACDTVVAAPYTGCNATLAVLLNRADAIDPANSAAINDPGTDGIFILGGDQGIAMEVLADSPAEEALDRAVQRGAAIGGTSAGNAVESKTMLNGYSAKAIGPVQGLQRGSTLVWWGDDGDAERGLSFGSEAAIYDQHFYQRGRLGRLLSTIATSDEHFAGASPLGVGVDYATGLRNTGDHTLSGVFGASSAAVIDFESMDATHAWAGRPAVLSARNVLTHLLTPGTAAYDIPTRTPSVGGAPVPKPQALGWSAPAAPGRGTLYLGGDVSGDFKSGVVPEFVRTANAASGSTGRIVVLSASAGDTATASSYAAGIRSAGWRGVVEQVAYAGADWSSVDLTGATGVVLVAADPTSLGQAMGDAVFRDRVAAAVRATPAVLADQHMAAALGSRWSPKADPTDDNYEDEAIAAFRADDGQWQPGLGLVAANVVPRLTGDYRWGELFGLGLEDPASLALGVAEGTAIALSPTAGASVLGATSVVALDARQAQFWTADNGSIGAANAILDLFAAGERLTSAR